MAVSSEWSNDGGSPTRLATLLNVAPLNPLQLKDLYILKYLFKH